MVEMYVRLFEEGTTVYRPVMASRIDEATFLILENDGVNSGDEVWEFPPGSIVIGEMVEIGGCPKLLAARLAGSVKTS